VSTHEIARLQAALQAACDPRQKSEIAARLREQQRHQAGDDRPVMEFSKDIVISGAPADIAGVMFDPGREREWMTAVTSSVPQTAGIQPGAEVRRTSTVGGTDVAWTTVVEQFHFPHVLRLVIRGDAAGAGSGYIRYEVQRYGTGTIAKVRASSEQDLFGFDLDKLKALVER
jgi:hypothetical protein